MILQMRPYCLSMIFLVILLTPCSYGEEPLKPGMGWVGLYNYEMTEWLENKNRLAELCPRLPGPAQKQCRDEKLRPKIWLIDVMKSPDNNSIKLGTIVIKATPGVGLSLAFMTSNSLTAFTPDLFDPDWGYGPYFHQTFREQRGFWYLLPENPLPKPGWVDLGRLTKSPNIKNVELGVVYELDGNSIVITRIENGKFTVRAEQLADKICGDAGSSKLRPAPQWELYWPDLLNSDGHLKLKIKYPRGC